jgi:hypothetical protein
MYRTCVAALFVLSLPGVEAHAQWGGHWWGWGGSSTVEGDYLRGLGFAASGMGEYNFKTAQAESINLETGIRWNEYLAAVAKEQTREYVMRKVADASKLKEFYKQNKDRVQNRPEAHDVLNSDALNAILDQLENANLGDSTMRTQRFQVPISADIIRRIPFKLSEKGLRFSMDRLCLKGKGAWTVALQDKRFEREKKAYALALDKALAQAIDGKMEMSAIKEVEDRADDLFAKLDQVVGRINDPLYIEARDRLKELKTTVELLKREQIERAIGEIDKYSGRTVNELKAFMQRHNLRFAAAATPEERSLYPELYASLVLQRDKLEIPSTAPIK